MTLRMLVLLVPLALSACERDTREPDPYAARLATSRPAYVRTGAAPLAAPAASDSVSDPQFTAEQALRGAAAYGATCARCHAIAQWKGGTFAAGWQGRRLSDLHDLMVTTMPQDAPSSLTQQQYVDITAYILELAGFRAGTVALRADSAMLRHARLTITPSTPPPS